MNTSKPKFKVGDELYPLFQNSDHNTGIIRAWREVMPITIAVINEYSYTLKHSGLSNKTEGRGIDWVETNFILATDAIKVLYFESKDNK